MWLCKNAGITKKYRICGINHSKFYASLRGLNLDENQQRVKEQSRQKVGGKAMKIELLPAMGMANAADWVLQLANFHDIKTTFPLPNV